MTDLDGTFLNDDKKISDENRSAVERLRQAGGIFTIATGRGYSMAKNMAEDIKLDFPAVVYNGAAIYDFQKEEFLWKCCLDSRAREYLQIVTKRFPDVGIEVLQEKQVYTTHINERERWHLELEKVQPVECRADEIPDGWLKVLFAGEPDLMDEVQKFIEKQHFEGVNMMRSAEFFYEMLPMNISKGYAFGKLLELTGTTTRTVAAAGDYYNDCDMVKMADIGFAVSNAIQAVKDAADVIVSDNNHNAIAEIVDYLEKNDII